MTGFVARTLRSRGFEPVLAYYEPYSLNPRLSVPSHQLLRRKPQSEQKVTLERCETHAIGAWLPELEFTQHIATESWRRLIEGAQAHVTVSGTALGALQYHQTGQPFLAWIATGWAEDRTHRVRHYPLVRKVLEHAVVSPVTRLLERSILKSGDILSLSQHTRRELDEIAGLPVVKNVLPQPVDVEFFSPRLDEQVRRRIGFSGRLDDPRKNVDLLLQALSVIVKGGNDVSALLIGGNPDARLSKRLSDLGIADRVEICPLLPPPSLRDRLRTLDLYVVPSAQEGLCIAALEAMACGLPVVSTRCGGPEEFVIDEATGRLVGFDAREMADAIISIIGDRPRRERLAAGARDLVRTHYSLARAEQIFWEAFGNRFS